MAVLLTDPSFDLVEDRLLVFSFDMDLPPFYKIDRLLPLRLRKRVDIQLKQRQSFANRAVEIMPATKRRTYYYRWNNIEGSIK